MQEYLERPVWVPPTNIRKLYSGSNKIQGGISYKHHFSTKIFGSGAYKKDPIKESPQLFVDNFFPSGAYKSYNIRGGAYSLYVIGASPCMETLYYETFLLKYII